MDAAQGDLKGFKKAIDREYINNLDLGQYEGPIRIIDQRDQLKEVFSELRNHKYVGFDTESKPVFVKGEYNHVALIQLAVASKVYLIRLNNTGLTIDIQRFFENPVQKKIGLALGNDLVDLQKLKDFRPRGFIDIQTTTKQLDMKVQGLRKLCALLLGFRISKSAQVSNWEADELSEKQLRYAATDAWACLKIYEKFLSRGIHPPEMQQFIENGTNGKS